MCEILQNSLSHQIESFSPFLNIWKCSKANEEERLSKIRSNCKQALFHYINHLRYLFYRDFFFTGGRGEEVCCNMKMHKSAATYMPVLL